jgi:hypothetical protein
MREEKIITMDYHEFEMLVKKHFGVTNYNFVATQECSNDTSHRFNIDELEPLNTYDAKSLKEFIDSNGTKSWVNYILFQELINREVLLPGKYLVEVYW